MARVGFFKMKNSKSNALNLISNYGSDDEDDDEMIINVESTKRHLEDSQDGPSKLIKTEDK